MNVEQKSPHSFIVTPDDHFPRLAEIARIEDMPLVIFDTETTGFINYDGTPTGIVEIAAAVIRPDGSAVIHDRLLDPECSIAEEASAVHGIDAAAIAGADTFASMLGAIKGWMGQRVIVGFNSLGYDVPLLRHNIRRYEPGAEPAQAARQIDVRMAWAKHTGSVYGKLTEVAGRLGVEIGEAHRAWGDVLTTMRCADRMIEMFGMDTISVARVATDGTRLGEHRVGVEQFVLDHVASHGQLLPRDYRQIEREAGVTSFDLSTALGNLLQARLVSSEILRDADQQEAIRDVLDEAVEQAGGRHRAKPLKQAVERLCGGPSGWVDYVQLRIASMEAYETEDVPAAGPMPDTLRPFSESGATPAQ